MMEPLPAEILNVIGEKRSWVDRRAAPQALAPFECPVLLCSTLDHIKKHYILADNWDPSPFRYFAQKVSGHPGWSLRSMPCGYNIMIDRPLELADMLSSLPLVLHRQDANDNVQPMASGRDMLARMF